jgi:hypothetical protein
MNCVRKTDSKFLMYTGYVCDKALTTADVLSEISVGFYVLNVNHTSSKNNNSFVFFLQT